MPAVNSLRIKQRPTDQLIPYARNARTHSDDQVHQIAASITEFGFNVPVLIDGEDGVIAGHGRILAAQQLGLETIPTIRLKHLTDTQRRAFIIADNKLTDNGGWDEEILAAEIRALQGEGFDVGITGFSDEELREIMRDLDGDDGPAGDAPVLRSSLTQQFLIPPFSVLDARQGYWSDRKRTWIALGIRGELGRGQDGNKAKGGMTYSVSSQPGKVYDRKAEIEKALGFALTWKEFAERHPEEIAAAGDSIFDPVLCEIAYRWFSPPGGKVLDPFAGGSVRGAVAAVLGYDYTGIDLRAEQIEANQDNWAEVAGRISTEPAQREQCQADGLTPIQGLDNGTWAKRDDLFSYAGARGGKVRSCRALSESAEGLVTAGSRASPQANIVAQIAREKGIPCRIHVPTGPLTPELEAAQAAGAEAVQHKPGYNSVIIKRARDDAKARGWTEIPFGMECQEAITQTRKQVANLPPEAQRLVVPVGSGMSLAGILHGLHDHGIELPVLGITVGADPTKRLDKYAPEGWREQVTLEPSGLDYHDPAPGTQIGGIAVDPIYEAKCIPFLERGDCLWIVGIRQTATDDGPAMVTPNWITGDSKDVSTLAPGDYDLLFTCPPYADLERYSDDPKDISAMDYPEFMEVYREIIQRSARLLRDDRFAVIVVGDVRDKKGFYQNFISDTIAAFEDAGLRYYNEAVLLTPITSLAMRAGATFRASRKLGKGHQNLLVFTKGEPDATDPVQGMANAIASQFDGHRQLLEAHEKMLVFTKGDPKTATLNCGTVEVDDVPAEEYA